MRVGILGYGEAGPVFARQALASGAEVWAFDILLNDPALATACRARMAEDGIGCAASATDLAARSDLILSTVTAANALAAAESLGALTGKSLIDLNSVGPATKMQIADRTDQRGGTFTAGVAMDTVPQKGARVPLLLSGPKAEAATKQLNALGLCARNVGRDYGASAQIKLVRSIFIKGFEAVFAEAMDIATPLGVWEEVCASLEQTFPGMDWARLVPYHIGRVEQHGRRRAQEMLECADMIEAAGLDPDLTQAIARKHAKVAAR